MVEEVIMENENGAVKLQAKGWRAKWDGKKWDIARHHILTNKMA